MIVVDTAHGHSEGVIERVRWVKQNFPQVDVIGGNIATGAAALALVEAGADAVKVGIGPGSICTTRIVAGVGVPQIMAIDNVAKALQGSGVPLIADGGMRYSGDIAKAIAAGADTRDDGRHVRRHRRGAGRGHPVPGPQLQELPRHGLDRRDEGRLGRPLLPGQPGATTRTPTSWCPKASKAACRTRARSSRSCSRWSAACARRWATAAARTIDEMHSKAEFVEITSAGMRESHVHDVQITKEAPNYRVE